MKHSQGWQKLGIVDKIQVYDEMGWVLDPSVHFGNHLTSLLTKWICI